MVFGEIYKISENYYYLYRYTLEDPIIAKYLHWGDFEYCGWTEDTVENLEKKGIIVWASDWERGIGR